MKITDTIYGVGVDDHAIDLFEGQYVVPEGMTYHSYVICDRQVAVLDTVEAAFGEQWLHNLRQVLGDREPNYLIVQHMEPDHSANILRFAETYPRAAVVASAKAFTMMAQFFGTTPAHTLTVGEGDTLCLGSRTLTFFTAPMVHWPEVIVTYDDGEQTLFSADAFGKFGAADRAGDWEREARRYYFGIVGKYGAQVQKLLQKAAGLPLRRICPLHGPVLDTNLEYYLGLYDGWSRYEAESAGVVIAYASMYGNTKKAAVRLAQKLQEKGCPAVVYDLAREDTAQVLAEAFRYDALVLACPTYNMGILPAMRDFITHLTERNFQNRTVACIENGSWAPAAARVMRELLSPCKNLTVAEPTVTVVSALSETSVAALDALADTLAKRGETK